MSVHFYLDEQSDHVNCDLPQSSCMHERFKMEFQTEQGEKLRICLHLVNNPCIYDKTLLTLGPLLGSNRLLHIPGLFNLSATNRNPKLF